MAVIWFALAALASVVAGVVLGTHLSPRHHKTVPGSTLAGRSTGLWASLGVIVGGSALGAWMIFHHHVVIGVALLVATYAVQLAAFWARTTKHPDQ
jgi:hypothetical protein